MVKGEVPTLKIFEDDNVIMVLDIRPANKGHSLIIPKGHFKSLFETPGEVLSSIMNAIVFGGSKIGQAVQAQGLNVVYGFGEIAGQRVPHVVVHLIPRFQDDKVYISWEPSQPTQDELKKTYELLSSELKKEVVVQQPEKKEPAETPVEVATPKSGQEEKKPEYDYSSWTKKRIP